MQPKKDEVVSADEMEDISGVVFNIQRYSIHDGPGIRTTVFLKGCPLACLWCQNPESQSREPEIMINRNLCAVCGRCVSECENGAISLLEECSVTDRMKCICCGRCVEVCPNEARKLSGTVMTVGEVVKEVLKDLDFYENSGGGVTLSGGEATFQPEFALAILRECKNSGMHTAIETCGYTSWEVLDRFLECTDLVLFDIKHMDDAVHKEGTGISNEKILENAAKMAKVKAMLVRVPLIPGFNDSEQDVRQIAAFVASLPNKVEVDLLAYNPLGEGKYESLGKGTIEHKEVQDEEYVEHLREVVNRELMKGRLKVVQ
jgi:pyruvate formate lyase activating enzyme